MYLLTYKRENENKTVAKYCKQAEASLERHRDRLEELVKERTANLEEANTALRVLLRQKDEHKAELEENVLANVNEFILPNLEKLKTMKMHGRDKEVLDAGSSPA